MRKLKHFLFGIVFILLFPLIAGFIRLYDWWHMRQRTRTLFF